MFLEDGTLVDFDGNVIGKAGELVNLVLDKDGKVIGYLTEDGKVYDLNGNQIGYVDENGNIVSTQDNTLGALVQTRMIPITPKGTVV